MTQAISSFVTSMLAEDQLAQRTRDGGEGTAAPLPFFPFLRTQASHSPEEIDTLTLKAKQNLEAVPRRERLAALQKLAEQPHYEVLAAGTRGTFDNERSAELRAAANRFKAWYDGALEQAQADYSESTRTAAAVINPKNAETLAVGLASPKA